MALTVAAQVAMKASRITTAYQFARRAADLAPMNSYCWSNLLMMQDQLYMFDGCRRSFDKAVRTAKNDDAKGAAYLNLGCMLVNKGDWAGAEQRLPYPAVDFAWRADAAGGSVVGRYDEQPWVKALAVARALEQTDADVMVIADGDIHVYAPLRGRAIAGARGNVNARIYSTCMEPQLVSVAGTYRTIETALPADVLGKPAQVRLEGDRLVVEPIKT